MRRTMASAPAGLILPSIVRNGVLVENTTLFSKKDFYASHPEGIYTHMRSVDMKSVFQWNIHIERLTVVQKTKERKIALEKRILETAQVSMKHFIETNPMFKGEMSISILINKYNDNNDIGVKEIKEIKEGGEEDIQLSDVYAYVDALKGYSKDNMVQIAIEAHNPRSNPGVKDLHWIMERKEVEDRLLPGENEAILCSPEDGRLYEGLSSNFFVIREKVKEKKRDNLYDLSSSTSNVFSDYIVQTAPPELVLPGSVRQLVLDMCKEKMVEVDFTTPRLTEISSWKAAAITSTSRMLLGVHTIRLDPTILGLLNKDETTRLETTCKGNKIVSFKENSLLQALQILVGDHIEDHSRVLLPIIC